MSYRSGKSQLKVCDVLGLRMTMYPPTRIEDLPLYLRCSRIQITYQLIDSQAQLKGGRRTAIGGNDVPGRRDGDPTQLPLGDAAGHDNYRVLSLERQRDLPMGCSLT